MTDKEEKVKEAPKPSTDKIDGKKESSSGPPGSESESKKESPQPSSSSDKSDDKKESSSKESEGSKSKESGPPGSKRGSTALIGSARKAFERRRPLILFDDQDEEDSEFVEREMLKNYAKYKPYSHRHGRPSANTNDFSK